MLFLQVTVAVPRRTSLDKKALKNNKYTKDLHLTSIPFSTIVTHKQHKYIKFTAINDSKDEWLPSHNPDLFVKSEVFSF